MVVLAGQLLSILICFSLIFYEWSTTKERRKRLNKFSSKKKIYCVFSTFDDACDIFYFFFFFFSSYNNKPSLRSSSIHFNQCSLLCRLCVVNIFRFLFFFCCCFYSLIREGKRISCIHGWNTHVLMWVI